jgi:putative flippase GtrA
MYILICASFNSHVSFFFGFISGVIFRFFIDRNFVFLQNKGLAGQQFLRYLVACMITYSISESLFFIFLEIVHLDRLMSFILAVVLTTICGYKLLSYSLNVAGNNTK